MLSRRLRWLLALAVTLGVASCELNPQPDIPSSNVGSGGSSGAATGGVGVIPAGGSGNAGSSASAGTPAAGGGGGAFPGGGSQAAGGESSSDAGAPGAGGETGAGGDSGQGGEGGAA